MWKLLMLVLLPILLIGGVAIGIVMWRRKATAAPVAPRVSPPATQGAAPPAPPPAAPPPAPRQDKPLWQQPAFLSTLVSAGSAIYSAVSSGGGDDGGSGYYV